HRDVRDTARVRPGRMRTKTSPVLAYARWATCSNFSGSLRSRRRASGALEGLDHQTCVRDEGRERQEDSVEHDVERLATPDVEHDREHHQQGEAGRGECRQPRENTRQRWQDEAESAKDLEDADGPE